MDEPNAVLIVDVGADGKELLHLAPFVAKGEDGFSLGDHSNVIGEDYRRHRDTRADIHRKEVELLAMQASTLEEAAAKRKAKVTPFGGRIDPEKHIVEATLPTFIPRRGTELQTATRMAQVAPELFTHFEAAKALAARGLVMNPELLATLKSLHPEGVPVDQIDALQARLTVRAGLRVVGGGA